ncbi:hypothetical protein [Streptomyces sp. NRRL B-24484]|uniref:hypothetical protein n=1 Tax=Streptomyces sp. NRRL B-24484 TaxID=1463833 RepID=UPI000A86DD0E|nr:hypothetical protein [Streptomyces sp. NRRL B-24484]
MGPFPERAARLLLVGRFLAEYYRLVAERSDRAVDLVERQPGDLRDAVVDPEHFAEAVRRPTWSEDRAR